MSDPRSSGPSDPFAELAAMGESEFHLTDHLRFVASRWRPIAVVTLLVAGWFVGDYMMTPKEYRATALIQIERRLAVPLGGIDNALLEAWWNTEYYPTQYRLLRSRGLAERVVLDMRLDQDAAFAPERAGQAPSVAPDDEAALAGLAGRILGGLEVNPLQGTQLVEISYRSGDPTLCARVANGVVDAFIDWGIESRALSAGKASTFYGEQIETLKREIHDKERDLQAYGRRTDIVSLDPSTNVTLQRLEALNRDYIAAISERIARQARLREIESASGARGGEVVADPVVSSLREDLVEMEREYASKLNLFKPEWPAMAELADRIQVARINLDSASAQVLVRELDGARSDYQRALRQEQSILSELERVKADSRELSGAAVEFSNLQIEISTKRQLLDELLRKQSETDVTSRLQSNRESNVRVVDRALVPGGPFRPSLRRSVTFGLGGGLLGGIALVFVARYLDRTIKDGDEAERLLGLPVLASVADVSVRGRRGRFRRMGYGGERYGYGYGYGQSAQEIDSDEPLAEAESSPENRIELLPHDHPRLAVAEAYRSLRTALLLSSAEQLRSVAVTSALPQEGKTSTSLNLAVVLSQLPKRVLLVDADLRKPRLHDVFAASNRVGLVSFLTRSAEVERLHFATKVPNLWVVPSGPVPPNPSELLASERMAEFVAWAQSSFDIVVFDSAPTLAVTDAILLGKKVDGTVLCLRAGRVDRRDARACRDRLRQADVRVLGVVLNCLRGVEAGYRSSGGYAYASYGGDAASGRVAQR